jgi:transposase
MSYPEIFKKQIEILYLNGLTQKEIAKKLNCSIATVKRVIKNSDNYDLIKQKKKEKSIENHKLAKSEYAARKKELEKQKQEEENILRWGMMEQQKIHAQMISKYS